MLSNHRYHGRSSVNAVVLTLLAGILVSCGENTESSDVRDVESLVTVPVRRQNMAVKVNATGTLEPIREIEIKSKASGQVLRLTVEVGSRVSQGVLLAQVDTTQLAVTLRQRLASLEHAQVKYRIAAAQKDRSDGMLAQGMISSDKHDQDVLAHVATRAGLINAEAALEQVRVQMAETVVRAPISGTILEKEVEVGQIISSATSGVSEGTELLTMADLSIMQVRVLVDETDLGRIRTGQHATVTPDAFSDRHFRGDILKIEPKAEKKRDATYYPVLIHIDNPGNILLPGMNCKVAIDIVSKDSALVASTDALVRPDEAEQIGELLGIEKDSVKAALERMGAGQSGGMRPDQISGFMSRDARARLLARMGGGRPQAKDIALVFVADSAAGIYPQAVRIGIKDWNVTEVTEGVEEGDILLMPPSAMVAEQFAEFQKLLERFGGKLPGKK
jgi:HlyD family secretion protein